jgi:hypothetical protein
LKQLGLAAAAAVVVLGLALAPRPVRADDYVTVRGAYYREHSTRVIQPMVEVERDSPQGLDVKAHFLVDAVTSASLAAGTPVDAIFTETRNETGLMLRKRWSRMELSGGYKYSAESDYWSHALGLNLSFRFWGDTARLGFSGGLTRDRITARARTPACATPPDASCSLQGSFGGVSYTQIITPDLLAQVVLESQYLVGFQGNPYRSVPNFGYEVVPSNRVRNAVAVRFAYHLPDAPTVLRLQYRYYVDFQPGADPENDPWHITSHTIEGRLYQPLTDDLEVRLAFRYYIQSRANFWCDAVARPGCYPPTAVYYSTDPKLGPVRTSYPEVKLVWQAAALEGVPVLGWLAAGMFEIAYGYYIQSTYFANAHVLQSGYTIPF